MFLSITTVDENAPDAFVPTPTTWTIMVIAFIALTIVFVKLIKKLNAKEKIVFIILAIIGYTALGCLGYAIVTTICKSYCARKENKKK